MPSGSSDTPYEAVIGLEIHVQLATRTKMFCRCAARFGAPPNTLTCPICLGYPGALPAPNRHAVDLAVLLATALDARVHRRSAFARKSYFYPDLPKGYQISQSAHPLATGGALHLPPDASSPGPAGARGTEPDPPVQRGRKIGLIRLHLEEDSGKLIHHAPSDDPPESDPGTLVDYNRCGVPLVEIVTHPELRTPSEARSLLQELHLLLRYLEVSDASMEEGSLRCDANVSLRPAGARDLGTRVEIKNLSSFRHVARALEHEVERQTARLRDGREIEAETRGFDEATGATRPLRAKEEAADYRYFPEPDLPPLEVSEERLRRLAAALPELPWDRRERLVADLGLTTDDASVLTAERPLADYFDRAAAAVPPDAIKAVADWVRTEILRELGARGQTTDTLARSLPPESLAELVRLVRAGEISHSAAKEVLTSVWGSDETPAQAVARLGLARVSDPARLAAWIETVLDAHPEEVERFLDGKEGLLGFFVGRVMRHSGGRADPARVRELAADALERRARARTTTALS